MRCFQWGLLSGGALSLLGLTVIAGWVDRQPALIQLLPGSHGMPWSTAVGLVLAGSLLMLAWRRFRREKLAAWERAVAEGLAFLLILLGTSALLEWQAGIHLGLSSDRESLRQWFADPNPVAGRMRPLTALGFIATGLAALLLPRAESAWAHVSAQVLALVVVFVGGFGILGDRVGLGTVFGAYLTPVLPASIAFVICGLSLSVLVRQGSAQRLGVAGDNAGRIAIITGAIVVLTGLGGILSGFAVLYPQAVGELQNNLALSLRHRGEVLQSAIQHAWLDSLNFGNQPLRLAVMGELARHPADRKLRGEIQAVAERYRDFGFSGVRFEDAAGREVASAGAFIAHSELSVAVATPSPSELLWWQAGYSLRTHTDMVENGRLVGRLTAERRLPAGDELNETAPFGPSLDFAVCAPAGAEMDCFPLRSTGGRVLRQISRSYGGQPLPMSFALAGRTGIVQATDYRGIEVIAAHMPLGKLGLGAVLKIDAAELYQPIARRLEPLLVVLLVVAAAAVVLMRIQVLPLVRTMAKEIEDRKRAEARLMESETTLSEITSTLGEGVCVLDRHGVVAFANPEVERLLGWPAAELVGKAAHTTFHYQKPDGTQFPVEQCTIQLAVEAGQAYRSLSECFVCRDGTMLPVSVIARPIFRHGELQGSVVSFEDISERKRIEEAQARLSASLRRLNEIAALSHLPLPEQFHQALALGAEHFGLEVGVLWQVERGRCEVLAQVSPPGTLKVGQVFPLGLTYSSITLAENGVLAVSRVADSPYAAHPCYREFKLEAHIGAPIVVGDKLFGTVCFGSHRPFLRGFDEGDREFVSLLAGWAASAIERHQIGEATRQSERRVRALLDASDESVLLLAPDGRILAINAFAARRFGLLPQAMVGRDFFAFLPPELALGRRAAVERVIAGGEPMYIQDELMGVAFDISLYPVKDEHGKVESIAVYGKDITEARRARQVEEIFRQLDTVLLKTQTGVESIAQMFCNELLPVFDLAAAWVGRSEKDGQLSVLASASARAEFLDRVKQNARRWKGGHDCCLPAGEVIRQGRRLEFSLDDPACAACRSEGTAAGAEAVLLLPLSVRGSVWGVLAVYMRDRERLEEVRHGLGAIASRLGGALESALQQEWLTLLDSALADVSNAVMITDADAHILWANQSLAKLTGYPSGELLGKTPRLFNSGKQDDSFYRQFWSTLTAGHAWRGEIVNARRDGSLYTVSETVTPLIDDTGKISHYVAVVDDISERKAMEERIRHAANFDLLTDLPNRGLFFDRLGQALVQARREGQPVALLFLDLDRFKAVNDKLGHDAGDLLLRTVAERLREEVRESDTVARLAGDEFTIILPRIANEADAVRVARKIVDAVSRPVDLKVKEVSIGVSIGVALFPKHGSNVAQVLDAADKAMYHAKRSGRNTVRVARAPGGAAAVIDGDARTGEPRS